jgi:hypothetical protein
MVIAGLSHLTEKGKRKTFRIHLGLIMQPLLLSYAIALLVMEELRLRAVCLAWIALNLIFLATPGNLRTNASFRSRQMRRDAGWRNAPR